MGCLQIQESSSLKPIYALRRKRPQKVQDHLEKLVQKDVHVQQFGPRVVNTKIACISIKFTVVVFFLQENAERELKKSFRCQKAFFKDLNPISVANLYQFNSCQVPIFHESRKNVHSLAQTFLIFS